MKNLDPLLAYYRGQDKLVEINGEREPEEITKDIERLIPAKAN